MGMLDTFTGGESSNAKADAEKALAQLMGTYTPDAQDLNLPELQQYAIAMGMSPAQMQAFLQSDNAFNNQNIDQSGTDAQIKALNQLSTVADAGAEGSATQRAQVEQINQDAARNLAGQRGAIDQQAQARGVPPGLLQAALQSQRAGEGQQDAHMAALNAQSGAYQQALQAMAQGGALGGQLQGQQNTQANTRAAAQNAMQQFNAANQQNASAGNANLQQQANAINTQNANQTSAANTGLANERTKYNAQVPETVFQNQMQKNAGISNQYNQNANLSQAQGGQNANLLGGLLGTAGTVIGGMYGGPMGAAVGGQLGSSIGGSDTKKPQTSAYAADGGVVRDGGVVSDPEEMMRAMEIMRSGKHGNFVPVPGPAQGVSMQDNKPVMYDTASQGGVACMKDGGMIPGEPQVPGDSPMNDTVPIQVSPGEAVIPRSTVQQNPMDVMRLLAGRPKSVPMPGEPLPQMGSAGTTHDPEDIAALLQAMKRMRGAQ